MAFEHVGQEENVDASSADRAGYAPAAAAGLFLVTLIRLAARPDAESGLIPRQPIWFPGGVTVFRSGFSR